MSRPRNKFMPATHAPKSARSIQVLRAPNLSRIPWLVHGFSTRLGGVSRPYGGRALNLGITPEDTRKAVAQNRAAFLSVAGAGQWPVCSLRQVHSDLIWPVAVATAQPAPALSCADEENVKRVFCGDGLITERSAILLAIRTADCLPLLLVDRRKRAIGAFHAGWRGTVKRIAEKGVGEMRRWFGSRPEDLEAAIGPGIHGCCYDVGEEVREQFRSQFAYASELFTEVKDANPIHERYPLLFLVARAPGHIEPFLPVKIKLDLVEANRRQLLDAGVKARSITASPLCTSCRTDLLFSHRAEKGVTGRMMAVIGIHPSGYRVNR
jgi:YfiH family protein